MFSNTKCLLLLCVLADLRLSKIGLNASHHREHKVHNIVLYPDKHSWCKTTTIKQVINNPGCASAEIDNNVCVGACFSYSIPHTQPSDPGEVIVPYCDSCQPSTTTWHQIKLQCDESKSDASPSQVKHVQIIQNCSCTSCDARHKVGSKVAYNVINNNDKSDLNNDADDAASSIKVANELFLLQSLHTAQASNESRSSEGNNTSSNINELADISLMTESATRISRSKLMHRLLNQKIIALLADIQLYNRRSDKEQLLDLLHVAQENVNDDRNVGGRNFVLPMADIQKNLEGEKKLGVHEAQDIQNYLQKLHNLKTHSSAGKNDMMPRNYKKSDDYDDQIHQFISNDLETTDPESRATHLDFQDSEFKNTGNNDYISSAADFSSKIPIWLHDMNDVAESNRNKNQQQLEITDVVEQEVHEQHILADHDHQREPQHPEHPQHHHQNSEHERLEQDTGVHKRHHHHHHHHELQPEHHQHHSHKSEQHNSESQVESETLTSSPANLLSEEAPSGYKPAEQHRPLHEQLDINAQELKPNHAGTLLSYEAVDTSD